MYLEREGLTSMRILVTSCCGPAGHNMISCFRMIKGSKLIVGTDINEYHLQLTNADVAYKIHHASEAKDLFLEDIAKIIKKHNIEMLYPQSDREVFVCSLHEEFNNYTLLPRPDAIAICRDKLQCAQWLSQKGIPVPVSYKLTRDTLRLFRTVEYPLWVRSRVGAGGYMSAKCANYQQLSRWVRFWWQKKSSLQWMVSEFLEGTNYSWNGLMVNGELITGFLKKRIEWLYRRIGTTSVQEVSHDNHAQDICEKALKAIDPSYTGLAMIDLIDDKITEINAGRLGTTANQFALMSDMYPLRGNHWYGNLPYLAYLSLKGEDFQVPKRNSLPEGLMYLRHVDMGWRVKDSLDYEEVK